MSDLINRQALKEAMYIEAMVKDSDEQKWDSGCWIRYKMFERVVESLPSAEREKGKWVFKNDIAAIPTGYYECSECKNGRLMYKENFCPNCGADMRGKQDEYNN